jgi:hypothetical protein
MNPDPPRETVVDRSFLPDLLPSLMSTISLCPNILLKNPRTVHDRRRSTLRNSPDPPGKTARTGNNRGGNINHLVVAKYSRIKSFDLSMSVTPIIAPTIRQSASFHSMNPQSDATIWKILPNGPLRRKSCYLTDPLPFSQWLAVVLPEE